jgi:ABC-type antimicrobial peptide transport system permease subunit
VGVVADVYQDGTNNKPPTAIYWPVLMNGFQGDGAWLRRGLAFVIRTPRAGSQTLVKDVDQAIWSEDANLPVRNVETLNDLFTRSMARTSFTLTMIAIAGSMALLLGMIGLYGVVAYSVSQRTREIGIRIAMGAQRATVTGMFVRQGLMLVAIGVAIGLAAATGTTRLMASLLFGVNPVDPATYLVVCVGLVGIAALASYLPSRRAATVDPMEALRTE